MSYRTIFHARLLALALLVPGSGSLQAEYVGFRFALEQTPDAPLAREVFAEVVGPDGITTRLPAYHERDRIWAVRARPTHVGDYQLGPVVESRATGMHTLRAQPEGPSRVTQSRSSQRMAIRRHPGDPTAFTRADGTT